MKKNLLTSKDLFEEQKNSDYDKLYLENNGFEDVNYDLKKEYPKEFEDLLKEFGIKT